MSQTLDRRSFLELSGAGAALALGVPHAEARSPRLRDIFPSVPRCQEAVVVDIRRYALDERMMFLVLQGLVNRKQPRLYLISTKDCEFWVDYYNERCGLDFIRYGSAFTTLDVFQEDIDGYRLYDPENLHTFNLAATMAGIDRALPVHPRYEKNAKRAGLRRVDDLQGKFRDRYDANQWSLDNLLPHCTTRVAANICMDRPHWSTVSVLAQDFVTSLGAFQMDCSASRAHPRDIGMLRELYARMEAPGCVLGWHCARDTEHEAVSLAADHGLFVLCNLRSTNYSIHQAVGHPAPDSYEQPLPEERRALSAKVESKVYIAPLITDGDAAWAMTNRLDGKWANPERGNIPMNWGFMPSVYHLGPGLLKYYQETRTDNDYLIAGPCGVGYTYPHLHPDPTPFLRMTREAMDRLGMNVANVGTWDPRLAYHGVNPFEFFDHMRRELPDTIGFVRGLGESVWAPSVLDGGAPIVYSNLAIHRNDDPWQRIQALVEACPNRPLFVFSYINHSITLAQMCDAASRNPEQIEFLRLDEFMTKLRVARSSGMVGSDLVPDKTGCRRLLMNEMRPKWSETLDDVLALAELDDASRADCLAHFAKRIGGCDLCDLTAAYQFDLCQSTAMMMKIACNGRGVYVGDRRKGTEDFLSLYTSVPNPDAIADVSEWWYRWDCDGVQDLPALQTATKNVVRAARWLQEVNDGWKPLPG